MAEHIRTDLFAQTVFYNGYWFSASMETRNVSIKNVYDSAGRTVTRKIVTLSIRDFITGTPDPGGLGIGGVDEGEDTFEDVRTKLAQPGGNLTIDNLGFGAFDFNSSDIDLVWGPKPQVISWRQMGAGNTIELIWTVEFCIVDGLGWLQSKAIMEFNYKLSFDIDESGYQRRVYSGYILIPQTRKSVNDRSLSDSADAYREKIVPNPVVGFRRLPGQFSLSEDKCRLDFTITDQEMSENIPPDYCIHAKASHRVESTNVSFMWWNATLNASYEMVKGTNPKFAVQAFIDLINSRTGPNQAKFITPAGPGGGQAAGLTFIPLRISVAEPDIYGKDRYEFSYTYKFSTSQANYLFASGLWTPAPGSNGNAQTWARWKTTLGNVWGARGLAKMGFKLSDDAIVDLGGQGIQLPSTNNGRPVAIVAPGAMKAIVEAVLPKNLKAATSWLSYVCNVRIQVIDEVANLKLLPQQNVQQQPGSPVVKAGDISNFKVPYPAQNQASSVLQKRAQPTVIATLEGSGMRAGFDINPPQLVSIAGLVPVAANLATNGFNSALVANFGVPITQAVWSLRYLLPSVPAGGVLTPDSIVLNNIRPGKPI